jgi:hypothetical protein
MRDPYNLLWIMPAKGTFTMLQRVKPPLNSVLNSHCHNRFSPQHHQELAFPQVSQRVGNATTEVSSRAENLLQKTLSWAEVNHTPLSVQQVEALKGMFDKNIHQCQSQVMEGVNRIAGLNTKHPEYEGLHKALRQELQGNPKLNKWVKWLLMLEYIPSTLTMLAVTKRMYDGMEEQKKISPQENRLLMRQEYARQAVGAGLHVGRTVLGFESVVWLMSGLKRHQEVKSLASELEHGNQIKQWMAKGLHITSDKMQKGWNLLYSEANQTIASIASLMLMNTLTYGITRPLMVNTAFWGLNNDRKVKPYAIEQHKQGGQPPKMQAIAETRRK